MKYYSKIDGLRCLAVFLVLLHHFAKYIAKYIYAGFYGVDLFFVISGFLVTTVLLQSNEDSFRKNYVRFIGRRTLRIFPVYYLTILIIWLSGQPIVRDNLIYLLTYTFNYALILKKLPKSPVTHFWSLSVEEQFYLFWPFVILLLKNKTTLLVTVILMVVLTGYAQQVFSIFPSVSRYNYISLFTRMAPLGLGALGAVVANKNQLPDKILSNKFLEYFVLLLLIVTLVTNYQLKLPVLGMCSLYLVIKAAFYNFSCNQFNQFLNNKYVMYIGTISYGIYVFHYPVLYYCNKYLFDPFWANTDFSFLGNFQKYTWHTWIIKFPVYSLLTIGLAGLSFKFIETPILKLKDQFFKYEHSKTPVTTMQPTNK